MAETRFPRWLIGAAFCMTLGVIVAALGGFHKSTPLFVGGLVSMLGAAPCGYGAWRGMQSATQTQLAAAIMTGIASVVLGGVLLLIGVLQVF